MSTPITASHHPAGYLLLSSVFTPAELDQLRAGVEAAVARVADQAARDQAPTTPAARDGHVLQTAGATSIHWEPTTATPTVRNLRPVTHLDPRLAALWADPRLTRPAAELLAVTEVGPLTSKISFKRARVGSEFTWHQDYTFLHQFLGAAAAQAVTAMVFLDGATASNGALRVLPGSHLTGPRPDRPQPHPHDPAPVPLDTPAGSVVLFPTLLVHQSEPNRSDRDRRALLLMYQPAGRPRLDEHDAQPPP